jgi:hypothetical protein
VAFLGLTDESEYCRIVAFLGLTDEFILQDFDIFRDLQMNLNIAGL